MDAKVTLSFDKAVIKKAKDFAATHGISLSRLTEFIFREMTAKRYDRLDELPIADWINTISEGETEYHISKPRKDLRDEFFESRKK